MPFYLTNENIEATMERNPDDVFNPSDVNQETTSQNTIIRELVSQAILQTIETTIGKKVIIDGLFEEASIINEDNCLSYLFSFETDNDEFEIIFHLPLGLQAILEQNKHKSEAMFLSLSQLIITLLEEEDFSYLQDIKLIDLSVKVLDNEKIETLDNLYYLDISIDAKEYTLYLQVDSEFNKIF